MAKLKISQTLFDFAFVAHDDEQHVVRTNVVGRRLLGTGGTYFCDTCGQLAEVVRWQLEKPEIGKLRVDAVCAFKVAH